MLLRKFKLFFSDTFRQAEKQVIQLPANHFDTKTPVVLVLAAFSLLFTEYFGRNPGYLMLADIFQAIRLEAFAISLKDFMETSENPQIHQLLYWVCSIFLFYILMPVLFIRILLKEKIRYYGLEGGQIFKHYKIYLLMLVIMIPLILLFSPTKSFQARYPFYRLSPGESLYPFFWVWQILYFIQFICVEFFFRGFLLHGLKRKFGYYSVFVMTVPYCMIHFGKPMPETISAIFAGIVLGTISLKSNSIWLGVLIHYTVAILMDLAALWHGGYLG